MNEMILKSFEYYKDDVAILLILINKDDKFILEKIMYNEKKIDLIVKKQFNDYLIAIEENNKLKSKS